MGELSIVNLVEKHIISRHHWNANALGIQGVVVRKVRVTPYKTVRESK
ncbi:MULTISPECIES: hypothetical protein [Microcoleaceae]|jgi:hypothetical protein|nr:hypothetical protein [Tychonema sp. BBK16]MCF6375674.1 hypothetical protein [Tychonema sp. BBK16]